MRRVISFLCTKKWLPFDADLKRLEIEGWPESETLHQCFVARVMPD
jgi:hypothetical protein